MGFFWKHFSSAETTGVIFLSFVFVCVWLISYYSFHLIFSFLIWILRVVALTVILFYNSLFGVCDFRWGPFLLLFWSSSLIDVIILCTMVQWLCNFRWERKKSPHFRWSDSRLTIVYSQIKKLSNNFIMLLY